MKSGPLKIFIDTNIWFSFFYGSNNCEKLINAHAEGKIKAVEFARENNIPYLGLCFGMQMAIIEFARNAANLKNANSEEVDPKTPHPVIHIIPNQKEYLQKNQYGGTIRLGNWPCKIRRGTTLHTIYKKDLIYERHRHRYEFNNKYKNQLTYLKY